MPRYFSAAIPTAPVAYTQTYSTAEKTISALPNDFLGADTVSEQAIRDAIADTKQALNAVIDDLQALGILK